MQRRYHATTYRVVYSALYVIRMFLQAALETLRDYSKAATTVAKNYEEKTAVGNFLKRRIKKTLEFLRHTRLVFHSGLAVIIW